MGIHEKTGNRAIGQDLPQVKGLKELNIARMAMHVAQAGWSGGILFDIVTLPFPIILAFKKAARSAAFPESVCNDKAVVAIID